MNDDRTHLSHPQRIAKYEVRRVLGKGAMGVVYEAFDPTIQRRVAIKTVHASLLNHEAGQDFRQRFAREAAAAGRCFHPNIVAVFDFGECSGAPYLVMEFVEGVEVKTLLGEGALTVASALSIQIQLLDALGFAHGEGVVHRDVKPGNMIQLSSGLMKVADFGIARLDATSMTREGALIGTPTHMAPEQFKGGEIDHRADIYSAGVVLYQLLTGYKPFRAGHVSELMYKVLNEPVPDPRERVPELPAALVDVIRQAMAKDAEERFQRAGDFAQALEQAVPDVQPASHPAARATRLISRDVDGRTAVPDGWDPAVLDQVAIELTKVLGPIARVLVQRLATETTSIEVLYERLASRIPDEQARQRFFKQARLTRAEQARIESATQTTKGAPARFDDEVLAGVAADLAHAVGPIARVLVKKAARQACSLEELYHRLTTHIDDDAERVAFLERMPKIG